MQVQRKRILQMLENGTISMDEALTLLENLQTDGEQQFEQETVIQEQPPKHEPILPNEQQEEPFKRAAEGKEKKEQQSSTKKDEPGIDEFLDDLRRDFTMVGDRFMQFMQTTVEKVKEMDLEAPFGRSFVFNNTVTHSAEGLKGISLILPSGKVTLHSSDEQDVRAEFTVKAYYKESKEETKREVLDKIAVTNENNTLHIVSEVKIGQVDLDLYIPNEQYETIKVQLTNGELRARSLNVQRFQVKTTNGTIQLNDITSEIVEAETLNGRVYLDGVLEEVDAQSLNGAVVVTTTSEKASRIEAKTVSGSVELYIPSTISLIGEISSAIGKLDLGLTDVARSTEQEQLFQRMIQFSKEIPEQKTNLRLVGKAKTGTVLVRYNL